MNLDQITAEIRPRESWEAVDLGIALTRRNYGRILLSTMIVVWPVWLLLGFLMRDHFWWLLLVIWWLNAVWEKIPLYFLSRTLFGGTQGTKDFLRDWMGWCWKRIAYSLLVFRLSPNRGLGLPAVMLEGVEGNDLSRRSRVLRQYSGQVGGLAGGMFAIALHTCWIQLVLLLYWLIPILNWREVTLAFDGGGDLPESFYWVCLGGYLAVFTLLMPFYTGGFFGLYLNARTKMEGWDVELIFRRMTRRLELLVLFLVFGWIGLANGQESPSPGGDKDPQVVIQKVLADEEFKIHTRTVKRYRARGGEESWDRTPDVFPERTSGPVSRGGGSLGGIDGTVIGWIALGAVLIYGLIILIRYLMARYGGAEKVFEEPAAETVLGMKVSRKSLPKDIVTRARECWEEGDSRESLSLLYRGALSWMIYKGGVPIRESDTEIDCYQRTEEVDIGVDRRKYFMALTATWIKMLYGQEKPAEPEMRRLLEEWPFEKQGASPAKVAVARTGAIVLFAIVMAGCSGLEVEEEIREIGYKGKARIYPFLAVERFLSEMSVTFERVYTFTELPGTDSVVLFPAEVDVFPQKAELLLDWVIEGGSVVYLLEGGDSFSSDTFESNGGDSDESGDAEIDEEEDYPFLDLIDIGVVSNAGKRDSVKWGGKAYQWSLGGGSGFRVPSDLWQEAKGFRAGKRKVASALQFEYGDGIITLVGQAAPWRNRKVGENDHASILWEILNRGREELNSVWLIRGSRASFWDLLTTYAWMPLIGILLLVLAWLWNSIPRFGPLVPDKDEGNRDFQEHLLITGRFFVRENLTSALVSPVQSHLKQKLRRYHLTESEESEEDWNRLSAATGIPEGTLREALLKKGNLAPKEYRRLIQVLQKIDLKS